MSRQRRRQRTPRHVPKQRLGLRYRIWLALIGFLFILGVAAAAIIQPSPSKPAPGRQVNIQGDQHVVSGQTHPTYNTTPPTSGWHYEDTTRWGIHSEPIADELQVHNLEHGGILVQYSCDDCPELVAKLEEVVKRYPSMVILAPYPDMPQRIALTAWGRIAKLSVFDEDTIASFIEAYRDKGPEKVPD